MTSNGSLHIPNFCGTFQDFRGETSGSSSFIVQGTNPNDRENQSRGNGMITQRHSNYNGVTRSADRKKWESRLGKLAKDAKTIYIGRFKTEKQAAEAYDTCLIRLKGRKAITNFPLEHYNVRSILKSEKFQIGEGASKVIKTETVDYIVNKSMSNITLSSTPIMKSSNGSPIISTHNPPENFQSITCPNFSSIVHDDLIQRTEPVPAQEFFLEINEGGVELDWDWDRDHDHSIENFGVWDPDNDLCIENIDRE